MSTGHKAGDSACIKRDGRFLLVYKYKERRTDRNISWGMGHLQSTSTQLMAEH